MVAPFRSDTTLVGSRINALPVHQSMKVRLMENQHRKISGYRELSAQEIDLMNRIKKAGQDLLSLQSELANKLVTDRESKLYSAKESVKGLEFEVRAYTEHTGASDECQEFRRFNDAEPQRWASIGKTDIQTGIMALVRAVAQPSGV